METRASTGADAYAPPQHQGPPAIQQALDFCRDHNDNTLRRQLTVARIPAPPFGEAQRARWMAARFRDIGLAGIRRDDAGNVLASLGDDDAGCGPGAPSTKAGRGGRGTGHSAEVAERGVRGTGHSADVAERGVPGSGDRRYPRAPGTGEHGCRCAPVVLAAHLDTIFPEGTDLEIRRDGDRWIGPGVTDNARGLAVLLTVAEALVQVKASFAPPIVFLATVGEEGAGDLRGIKHAFRKGSGLRGAAGLIAIDGAGDRRIVNGAVGSRRLRFIASGPGGHSWADWGRPNPIHALSRAVAYLYALNLPDHPLTTLTVGRIGGGRSVNAIPERAWFEIDLRSRDTGVLRSLETNVRQVIHDALDHANRGRIRGSRPLTLETEIIGDRPAGETAPDHPLVHAAVDVARTDGRTPELVASSTDANFPISLGIPAITLGGGGSAGDIHTIGEWYRDNGGVEGVQRVLRTVWRVSR